MSVPVVLVTGALAGTPEEITQSIVFLASDKAGFITGQVVGVNGGKTAL